MLGKVFESGADAVLLDLEDAVPAALKEKARQLVADAAAARPCWVRVNRPTSPECARDLDALKDRVLGFRLPKVEGGSDVAWVAARAPGVALDCTIESARGVQRANEIAGSPGCSRLSYGGIDLALDLGIDSGESDLIFARSAIVIAARAADRPPPSDGVFPRLNDDTGLQRDAEAARRLGFFGKSAIHPRQVPIINAVFTRAQSDREWARKVLAAFEASGGAATRLDDGEFIDLPVAERARRILRLE